MARESSLYFVRVLFFLITTLLNAVFGDSSDDDCNGRVSVGAIVAAGVVGFIIGFIHECCIKPMRTVKPQRISVVGLTRHTVPPSRVIPSALPCSFRGERAVSSRKRLEVLNCYVMSCVPSDPSVMYQYPCGTVGETPLGLRGNYTTPPPS
ncbi:Hypothetical predicted protein [Mytilus galloprovincialis]|uniref:Uncharacterized protein n=1 Tax=Mytilus galloprovincialis TaxID=29158 RepID=A0A8B6FID0_MYTGA|nr:Hypothetical predicted protein [Mytilus galloprovincialis]